jgi:hypothetical protein
MHEPIKRGIQTGASWARAVRAFRSILGARIRSIFMKINDFDDIMPMLVALPHKEKTQIKTFKNKKIFLITLEQGAITAIFVRRESLERRSV